MLLKRSASGAVRMLVRVKWMRRRGCVIHVLVACLIEPVHLDENHSKTIGRTPHTIRMARRAD